ncbi:hypothetical protein U1Q18_019506 [Sarracenia purpurea var. burkii]
MLLVTKLFSSPKGFHLRRREKNPKPCADPNRGQQRVCLAYGKIKSLNRGDFGANRRRWFPAHDLGFRRSRSRRLSVRRRRRFQRRLWLKKKTRKSQRRRGSNARSSSSGGSGGVSSTSDGLAVLPISFPSEVIGARKLTDFGDFGAEEESQSSGFAGAKKKVRTNDPCGGEREVEEGLRWPTKWWRR